MPNEEAPFALNYESKTVVPIEVAMLTYTVQHFDQSSNDEKLEAQLDLLEEKRQEAKTRTMITKEKRQTLL